MIMKEEAVEKAIVFTEDAIRALESNLSYMKNQSATYLSEWHDANVTKYLEIQEMFDSYVQVTASNMQDIADMLRAYLGYMLQYNN